MDYLSAHIFGHSVRPATIWRVLCGRYTHNHPPKFSESALVALSHSGLRRDHRTIGWLVLSVITITGLIGRLGRWGELPPGATVLPPLPGGFYEVADGHC